MVGSLAPMRKATATALVLAAAVLAACGEGDATETQTISVEVPPASTTTATPESEAPVAPDDSAGNPEEADDPGADRPRAVEDVITAVLTGSETPETICDSLVTPEYVETAYGDRDGCLAGQKPGALADSIERITADESGGGTASAIAIPVGGPYDGVEVEVGLVSATDLEGAWVVNSLVADVPAGP
jgi:hypothetical protein